MFIQSNEDGKSAVPTRASEDFAMPDSLAHYFVIVPSKLRLVTLAAFLMWKCMVSADNESNLRTFVYLFECEIVSSVS